MVEKKKAVKATVVSSKESKVTRIKATDTKSSKPKAPTVKRNTPKILKPFVMLGGYFVGAWKELREVRWPNRRATWELTLAVILFSILLAVIILLLDALFNFVFDQIIQ